MIKRFGGSNYNYIVAVAGQSNAVGYDESPVDGKFLYNSVDSTRIKQLGFYGDENLKLIELGHCAQNMQDMRSKKDVNGVAGTKGIHLPLANLMLNHIPHDYGVVILPLAYGGTGFTGNAGKGTYDKEQLKPIDKNATSGDGTTIQKWGADTAYFYTLRDRIKYMLDLNPHNIFAGVVWIQGENDRTNSAGHFTAFQQMTQALFDYMNNNGYASRVPKGVWDKDIWYNVETVYSWYGRNQIDTIWANYKKWNEKTYVEIPRDTESNNYNGTGSTASNKPDHFGNNAYLKVVAPRVLQKMIDMNTFPNKNNVAPNIDYSLVTEGTRLVKATDVTINATQNITIDESGNCQADVDLDQTFDVNTCKPNINFGDIFKLEFTVTRNIYWLMIEGNPEEGRVMLLGLGGGKTHQIALVENGKLTVRVNASSHANKQYNFVVGDKVKIYRNADKSLTFHRTNNADGVYQYWFYVPKRHVLQGDCLGLAVGIAGDEFSAPFNAEKMKIFDACKIQKKELFPNNKLIDLQLTSLTENSNPKNSIGFVFKTIFSEYPNSGDKVALRNNVTYDIIREKIDNGEIVACDIVFRGQPIVGGQGGYTQTIYRTNSCIIGNAGITFTFMRYQNTMLPAGLELLEVAIYQNDPTNVTLTRRS